MSELDQLRQEAEQLKSQIRVRFPVPASWANSARRRPLGDVQLSGGDGAFRVGTDLCDARQHSARLLDTATAEIKKDDDILARYRRGVRSGGASLSGSVR